MEIHPAIISNRRRAALLAAVCLFGPMALKVSHAAEDLAGTELSRRSSAIQEAQELLIKGDEAYLTGRYDQAIEAFAGARELIPDAPISAELRAAATQRYAMASVEQARVLSKNGDVAAAKATVDKVLVDGVAPADPGALAMRAQLDDPIRTNPAITAEHSKDVDQVRRLLYTAEAAFDLGKFDESTSHYREVLRIDPTNTAAIRGMERISATKSGYQKAAYDHTRAEMFSQLDAAWETQIPAPDLGLGPEELGGAPDSNLGAITIAAKLDQTIIKKISFDQVTLTEAIEFLRATTRKPELAGTDSEFINFTLNLGPPDSETAIRINKQKFDLQLSQVPLSEVLKYITSQTRTSFHTDDFSVIITPAGSTSSELITRTYRVTHDFLTNISSGGEAPAAATDPFAQDTGNTGLLTKRLSAQEAFASQGIGFPNGASATYSPASNTLRVINTAANQDIIAQIVEAAGQTEPVSVSVRVTMIKTQQTNLEELSFDWLLSPFNLDSNSKLIGDGGTVGSTSGRTASDFTDTVPLPISPDATVDKGLITNGLRSGDLAETADNLNAIINNPTRQTQNPSVAPGILSLTGLFSDGQAQMLMRGLNQKKGVDVMARPSIITRSGQAASVLMAREFIYPTEYDAPELPNQGNNNNNGGGGIGNGIGNRGGQPAPVTPANPTTFEMREVGVSLEVLPVADADKRFINVTINPSITDFDGFVNYGSPITSTVEDALGNTSQVLLTQNTILMPIFSAQKTTSELTVADGSTIVISGLMSESIQKVEDKVPVLGNLPYVGRWFQSIVNKPVSTVIIFLVHVELLDPTGRPYRDR